MGGRSKTVLVTIPQGKKRSAAFRKRKIGLLKKSIELAVLCDSEVAILVKSNNKWTQFASHDLEGTWNRFRTFAGTCEVVQLDDYDKLESGKCLPTSTMHQIAGGSVNEDSASTEAVEAICADLPLSKNILPASQEIIIPKVVPAQRPAPLSELASPWERSSAPNDQIDDVANPADARCPLSALDAIWRKVFVRPQH